MLEPAVSADISRVGNTRWVRAIYCYGQSDHRYSAGTDFAAGELFQWANRLQQADKVGSGVKLVAIWQVGTTLCGHNVVHVGGSYCWSRVVLQRRELSMQTYTGSAGLSNRRLFDEYGVWALHVLGHLKPSLLNPETMKATALSVNLSATVCWDIFRSSS